MPFSSAEIAQMNGAFQGVAMQQQQYSGMIGQGYGGGSLYGGAMSGGMGDRVMGGAMSRVGAVGAPIMTGAAGLMGLDPMSLGLKAGIGAYGAGMGLGGAAMAGGAVALPAMAFGAAAQHVGQQMWEGAGQQMNLNQTLRGSYNFRNAQGGQGFNRSDMTSIGTMIRDMSGQFGPGGEITGFRELTQLAGKMSTMGLAQGVKDVKDFAERFKTMVTSLKHMATDLGTTLEGAMEFAAAAKQSGVFGMGRAAAFTSAARQTAVAGGLAVSEVTGAGLIGSQISRAMGGLGRQGNNAGMRTIGQIGSATQMGVLSEEDIYNVTGLTGAEGRQAYATSSMQKTASFLQSGRGRRMLASMAGKDGTLDESAVQEFLSGGMSIQETMRLDNKMKSTVGRANFIRNEGRLRGAAMERLGAFLPAMQMQQWAASKGIDINDMDDRSMLFAQRQLGMGRDEVDQAIKMAKAMPRILQQQRQSAEDDAFHQGMGLQRKQMGIEGIRTRFDQAKEQINSKLQKAGQDVLNAGSEAVDSFFTHLAGQYSQTVSEKADAAYRSAMFGGAASKSNFQTYFGGTPRGLAGRGGAGISGLGGRSLEQAMTTGTMGGGMESLKVSLFGSPADIMKNNGGFGNFLMSGQSGMGKYKEAGYDLTKGAGTLQKKLTDINDMVNAVTNEAPPAAYIALGKQNSAWMNDFYASSLGGLHGDERMKAFQERLDKQDPELGKKFRAASPAEKGRIVSGMEVGAGIAMEARAANTLKTPEMGVFGAGFKGTEAERADAYAAAFGARKSAGAMLAGGAAGGMLASTLAMIPGIGMLAAAALPHLGISLAETTAGTAGQRRGLGNALKDDTYREYVGGIFSGNEKVTAEARAKVQRDIQSLEGKNDEETQGRRAALQGLLASKEYLDLGPNVTDAQANEIMKKYGGLTTMGFAGGGKAALERMLNANAAIYKQQGDEITLSQARRRQTAGAADVRKMSAMGLATFEGGQVKLSGATLDSIKGIKGGEAVLKAAMGASATEANLNLTDAAAARSGLDQSEKGWAAFQDQLAGMSVADKRKMAAATAGTTLGAMIGESAATQAGLEKGLKRRGGGVLAAAAGGLGVTLTADEKKKFGGKNMDEAAIAELIGGKFLGEHQASSALQGDIKQYVADLKHGDTGKAAKGLQGIMSNDEVQKAMKERDQKRTEEADPLQTAIKKNTEDAAHMLTKLVERGVKVMNVQEFVAAQMQDVEEKAKGASDKNAGKSGR